MEANKRKSDEGEIKRCERWSEEKKRKKEGREEGTKKEDHKDEK